jgi:predicted O-methyltransferase YrrM
MNIKDFVPKVNVGSVMLDDAELLRGLVKSLNPHIIVEIGTFIGTSTVVMAQALKENGSVGKIYTVDKNMLEVEKKLVEHGLDDLVVLHYLDSYKFSENIVKQLPRIDFVFYDGTATKEQYRRHFDLLRTKMPKGSIYAVHDRFTRAGAHSAFLEGLTDRYVTIPTAKGLTLIQV